MKKGRLLLAVLIILGVAASPGCSRLEKPIINARDYEPFQEKVYPAPTRYIQVNGVNMAYIEKGEGPTVIMIHGGVIPVRTLTSYALTPLWDMPLPVLLYLFLDLSFIPSPLDMGGYVIIPNLIIPPRAKSLAQLGAVATTETWQYNFDTLAKKFHVIALDLPGFGNSEKPDIDYSVPELTTYIYGFMNEKQIENATLVGHDIGGLLAIDFCLTYPEKVNSLILISPYGTAKYKYGLGLINFAHYPRPVARMYQKERAGQTNIWLSLLRLNGKNTYRKILHRKSPKIMGAAPENRPVSLIHSDEGPAKEFMDQVVEYKFQYIKTREFSDELHATHLVLVDSGRYDLKGIMKMNPDKRTDWVTRVGDIQVPTLIIWGKYEPHLATPMKKAKEADYLDKAIPNSLVSIYENSAHYPMVEEPEKFNKDVMVFLEGAATP